ncbi:MAG: repeat domain protein [Myxococcaceae bacterium]|nr:repeat domain protein [Myxococcaceae bacterium]MEA2747338.1 hypothetical protein [Myxococcales bacterium]
MTKRPPRRASGLLLAPLALAAVIAASAAPGCYGATEIDVTLSTTADCSRMVTQVFTGATGIKDFGSSPAVETTQCDATVGGRIGTLSIVPSGSRDGHFDLEVVGAVGVPASDCRAIMNATSSGGAVVPAKTTGCIVARRRVSFRPHKPISLPILLSASCIDVPCGLDQTCDVGVCTPTVACDESGCPRERQVDGSALPPPDAGIDASADAADAAVHCGPSPELVVDGQNIVGQLSLAGADSLVYLDVAGTVGAERGEARRVARAGGVPDSVASAPQPYAFAGNTEIFALASRFGGSTEMFRRGSDGTLQTVLLGGNQITMAFSGNTAVGFVSLAASSTLQAFAISDVTADGGDVTALDPQQVPGPVPEVLADEDGDFYGVSLPGVLVHYTLAGAAPHYAGKLGFATAVGDIAVSNRTVYLAAALDSGAGGIFRVPGGSILDTTMETPWIVLPAGASMPQSLATDGVSLYYLTGTTVSRAELAASGAMMPPITQIATTRPNADRLQVDDHCIYWVEDGVRIMRQAK